MAQAGGTATEQAQRCGFRTPTQLHNTVARLTERPDAVELATLRKIADGLGAPFDWLVTGREGLATAALRAPRFCDLPNWPELQADALAGATKPYPSWVWEVVGDSRPVVPPEHVRAGDILAFAEYVLHHGRRPA